MIQIKSTSTLFFAVLLTSWVPFTSSQPAFDRHDEYDLFLRRLGQAISASSPGALPLWLNGCGIQNLMSTSEEFKKLCLFYSNARSHSSANSPIMALSYAINDIFFHYVHSAPNDNNLIETLEKIKSTDPIGFNVYLTQHIVGISRKNPSRRFMQFVLEFQGNTDQRVRLLNMKTNNSCFEIFDEHNSATPYNIPPTVRNEIATEYGPLSEVSIDQFIDFVTTISPRTMYRVGTNNLHDYKPYFSNKFVDVQILNDIDSQETHHAICICYKPMSSTVYVYDSLMREKLDAKQEVIIKRLYPFKMNTTYATPRTVQDKSHPTGAIFAIMYTSMLMLGRDPARGPIKLNTVCGDETLYMRIHILNMLASQKLAFLK